MGAICGDGTMQTKSGADRTALGLAADQVFEMKRVQGTSTVRHDRAQLLSLLLALCRHGTFSWHCFLGGGLPGCIEPRLSFALANAA